MQPRENNRSSTCAGQSDQGAAAITVICAAAVMSLLLALMFLLDLRSSRLARDTVINHNRKAMNRLQLSVGLRTLCEQAATPFTCSASEPSNLIDERLCVLCRLSPFKLAGNSAMPLIDYAELFKAAAHCNEPVAFPVLRTPSGFKISKAAVIASSLCHNPALPAAGGIFDGNLYLSSGIPAPDLSLPYQHPYLLAATGYLDIPGAITLHQDLILIAGGDIHLGSIEIPDNSKSLTIISAGGSIVVDSSSIPFTFQGAARLEVYLPTEVTVQTVKEPPYGIEGILLGIL